MKARARKALALSSLPPYSPIEQPTLVLTGLWFIDPESGQRAAYVCCCRDDTDYVSFFVSEEKVPVPGGKFKCPKCYATDEHLVIELKEAVKLGLFDISPNSDRDHFYGPDVEMVLGQIDSSSPRGQKSQARRTS